MSRAGSARRIATAIAMVSTVSAGLIACVGGGGGYSSDFESWDSPPGSQERSSTSTERAPSSAERSATTQEGTTTTAENAPGAQGAVGAGAGSTGGGGFACSGSYTCTQLQNGQTKSTTINLSTVNGKCSLTDSKSKSVIVFETDGRVTVSGVSFGTWSASGTGFSLTTEDGTVNCAKGGSASSSSSSSSSSGSSSSTSGSPGTQPIDAGTRG